VYEDDEQRLYPTATAPHIFRQGLTCYNQEHLSKNFDPEPLTSQISTSSDDWLGDTTYLIEGERAFDVDPFSDLPFIACFDDKCLDEDDEATCRQSSP
jgi:hypothetical protein